MTNSRMDAATGRRPAVPALRTRLLWTSADSVVWVASLVVATWLRLDFAITDLYATPLVVATAVVVRST